MAFIVATYRAPQSVEYLMPAYVPIALGIGCAISLPFRLLTPQPPGPRLRLPEGLPALLTAALLLPIPSLGRAHLPSYRTLHNDRSAREYAESVLLDAPRGAHILANWHWYTPLRYLQLVDGQRPDVDVTYIYPQGATTMPYAWPQRIAHELETSDRPLIVTNHYPTYADLPQRLVPHGGAFLVPRMELQEELEGRKGTSRIRRVRVNVDAPDGWEAVSTMKRTGDGFDPALNGYWGSHDFERTMRTCLEVIRSNVAKVDGIKISLLDKDKEIQMRRLLPDGVKMYTGDDFNYPELIAGDEQGFSHALLGIFDAIAPAASQALAALAQGNQQRFHGLLEPTVPLSRLVFRAPTQYYKTGVVFLAWLNGHQQHFVMVGGAQAMRPLPYFCELFRLADQAGLLRDPALAAERMRSLLSLYGIDGR